MYGVVKNSVAYDNINVADYQTQKEFIWKYLTEDVGLSNVHAAAMMGNFEVESYLSPLCLQNVSTGNNRHYEDYIDDYSINDDKGWGIAQWTYWSRKEGLLNYANEKGTNVGDLVTQLEYLIYELNNDNPYKREYVKSLELKDLDDATVFFCDNIERPEEESAHLGERLKAANKIYNEFVH